MPLARNARIAAVASAAAGAAAFDGDFAAFQAGFGKKYEDPAEAAARAAAFQDNLAFIEAENRKGHSYTLGVNEFADMTLDEFALTRLGLRAPSGERWGSLPRLGSHKVSGRQLPDSVDWVQEGAVTPVKNQAQCGSCWAFSTTGALEGAWKIAKGTLVSMSEQQLVDCAKSFGEMGCSGGIMDNAFQYAEANDMCTEESYPYAAKGGICRKSSCSVGMPKGSVVGFKDVETLSKEALMDAVAQQPVSIAIEADQRVFQLYKGGVLSVECGEKLDHGVLVVGYGTDNGEDYWKVKNSWGPSWGEEGYVRLARGKGGAGECGLKTQPSYPVISDSSLASAPATTHYERPPCRDDEVAAGIQQLPGKVTCMPKCDGASCPSDVPPGTTAKPQCALEDASTGNRYCGLICSDDSQCPSGASCGKISVVGLCVYPMGEATKSLVSFRGQEQAITI